MDFELKQKIESVNGQRKNREQNAQFVIDNPHYFKDLFFFSFSTSQTDAYKACWILEIVSYKKLDWFIDYLDFFFENLKKLNNESSIRPMSKIIQLLLKSHFSKSETRISLSEKQLQNSIEISFDWLITDTKVATKAYSMRNLYLLGKQNQWIHSELKIILEKEYTHHSAAYKAVAREVLKKIK